MPARLNNLGQVNRIFRTMTCLVAVVIVAVMPGLALIVSRSFMSATDPPLGDTMGNELNGVPSNGTPSCTITIGEEWWENAEYGINNQFLTIAFLIRRITRIVESPSVPLDSLIRQCVFQVPRLQFYEYPGDPPGTRFVYPIDAVLNVSASRYLIAPLPPEQREQDNLIHVNSYNLNEEILRHSNSLSSSSLAFYFDTTGIIGSMYISWWLRGFFFPDREISTILRSLLHFSSSFPNITNEQLQYYQSMTTTTTLAIHLRYPPHCLSSGEHWHFGGWAFALYPCDPTIEQWENNLRELLLFYSSYHIERVVIVTETHHVAKNKTQQLKQFLLSHFEKENIHFSSELLFSFDGRPHQKALFDFLLLQQASITLSSYFSTFSLIPALMRQFKNTYFVKTTSWTFGRVCGRIQGSFFGLAIFLCCCWGIKRRKKKRRSNTKIIVLAVYAAIGWIIGFVFEWVILFFVAAYSVHWKRLYQMFLV